MNPLSFTLSPPASQGTANTPASTGRTGNADAGSGFDGLLQQAPPSSKDAAPPAPQDVQKPASKPSNGAKDAGSEKRPGSGAPPADTPADGDDAPAGVEKPAASSGQDGTQRDKDPSDDLPWPPPGLAGLLPIDAPAPPLAGPVPPLASADVMPETGSALPATPLPGTGIALQAQAASGPATPAAATATPAAAALPAASTGTPLVGQAAPAPEALEQAALDAIAQLAGSDTAPSRLGSDSAVPAADAGAGAAAMFGTLLQNLGAVGDARAAVPFPEALSAPAHVHAPDFDEAIGARVGWLADQKIGQAHIRVTPHDLGPVDVRLQLDGDRVHASFTSAHAEVRQALENSLPKLREMLDEQGLQLAHADVGQQHSDPHAAAGEGLSSGAGGDADTGGAPAVTGAAMPHIQLRGLLDAYA